VFLQEKTDKANRIAFEALSDGIKLSFFNDDYYPKSFGWTAVAFYPMTEAEGKKYFKGLKLA
jgi:hypothetical protein